MKALIRATIRAATLMPAQPASLNFERSQTLNGWHERAPTGKVWYDLAHARNPVPDRPQNARAAIAPMLHFSTMRSEHRLFQRP